MNKLYSFLIILLVSRNLHGSMDIHQLNQQDKKSENQSNNKNDEVFGLSIENQNEIEKLKKRYEKLDNELMRRNKTIKSFEEQKKRWGYNFLEKEEENQNLKGKVKSFEEQIKGYVQDFLEKEEKIQNLKNNVYVLSKQVRKYEEIIEGLKQKVTKITNMSIEELSTAEELIPEEGKKNKEACAICQNLMYAKESTVSTPCNHQFHIWCIEPCLKEQNQNQCPMCRRGNLVMEADKIVEQNNHNHNHNQYIF